MSVFVLDVRKRPLMPCSEKRARLLLSRGRARVARRYPFTIRLVDVRVAVRATGSFKIQTLTGVVQGVNAKYCTAISRADGYSYSQQKGAVSSPCINAGVSTAQDR